MRVSPRTLLRYFPTKEDVIVAWIAEVMADLPRSVAARPLSESPDKALKSAARAMLQPYVSNAKFFLPLERVISEYPSLSARKQQMIEDLVCKLTVTLGSRCKQKGRGPLPSDVYAGVIVQVVRAAVRSWLATNGRRSILELFDDAASVVQFVDMPKSR